MTARLGIKWLPQSYLLLQSVSLNSELLQLGNRNAELLSTSASKCAGSEKLCEGSVP